MYRAERYTFEKTLRRGATRINHQGFERILSCCFEGEALKEAVFSPVTPSG
jgi:hypothetical protein